MEITRTQMNKLKDLSKYYMNIIKNKKDIEKYLHNTKKLEVLEEDIVALVGNVYNETYLEDLKQDDKLPTVCKMIKVKILDMKEFQGCEYILTIYYNNNKDLAEIDEEFYGDYETNEYKQQIYKIVY